MSCSNCGSPPAMCMCVGPSFGGFTNQTEFVPVNVPKPMFGGTAMVIVHEDGSYQVFSSVVVDHETGMLEPVKVKEPRKG